MKAQVPVGVGGIVGLRLGLDLERLPVVGDSRVPDAVQEVLQDVGLLGDLVNDGHATYSDLWNTRQRKQIKQ